MGGYFLGLVSIAGVIFFSSCLFLSDSMSMFWLFLELSALSLVPSFFLRLGSGVLEALFNYLVVSSISSSLMICGLFYDSLLFLCFFGLSMKFGVFPFQGWIYKVLLSSGWLVVWGFSVFLKIPFLFICFFLSSGGAFFLNVVCVLSFLFLGGLFWCYSYSWCHCWCHMMLSSSVVLVAMSVEGSGDALFYLFVVYTLWGSAVLLFLGYSSIGVCLGLVLILCFGVASVPATVCLCFYKVWLAVSVFCLLSACFCGLVSLQCVWAAVLD
uniref:NADH dehydrogenase subunit 2 n=1 Tax=Paragonimus westermani TaxID=34504 RepID=A0A1P8P0I2_9TREM|nr:NADH dehydrogenase subunit 2 [Paragonimus westermani]